MINVQAEAEDWLDFLEQQPALVSKCRDIQALYCTDPDRWEEIVAKSETGNCTRFALLWHCGGGEWQELFKVSVEDGKVEFYDISDPGSCEDFIEFAGKNFSEFFNEMKNCTEDERFVSIIG
jgi:hypothetical protein